MGFSLYILAACHCNFFSTLANKLLSLSVSHFVVACEFLKDTTVDINSPKIAQRIFKFVNIHEF